jgi:site-specific DNA-methyltransferase (cytosine-N4-specific)
VKPYYADESVTLYHGDSLAVLREMPDQSVDCCVTSPPYFGLRDYGEEGQYGLEASPAEYVETMRALFAEVRRVLADDGTLWLNLGDSYANGGGSGAPSPSSTLWGNGHRGGGPKMHAPAMTTPKRADGLPAKNLLGIPWRTAFALQDDGWTLRNDIIWSKPNAMPESVTDRLSTRHEHLFMFSKSPRYWFDLDPIREAHVTGDRPLTPHTNTPGQWAKGTGMTRHRHAGPEGVGRNDSGRNPGDVWAVATQPFAAAHFAVMPSELARRAVVAGCKPGGVVLDPFSGSGTTGLVAGRTGRRYVGIDLNRDYLDLSLRTRLAQTSILDIGSAS